VRRSVARVGHIAHICQASANLDQLLGLVRVVKGQYIEPKAVADRLGNPLDLLRVVIAANRSEPVPLISGRAT
jgi:hypothetical protein